MKTKNLVITFIVSCLVLFAWPVMLPAGDMSLAEVINGNSILEGWHHIVWGLQEYGGYDPSFSWPFQMTYAANSATLTLNPNQTLNGKPLSASGSGSLDGSVGSEDLTWTCLWTGSYDGHSLSGSDTAIWLIDTVKGGYYGMDFHQNSKLQSPEVPWEARGMEVCGGIAAGAATGSWLAGLSVGTTLWTVSDIYYTFVEEVFAGEMTVTAYGDIGEFEVEQEYIGTHATGSVTTIGGGAGGGTTVPEPATILLLGFGGLAMLRKRRA